MFSVQKILYAIDFSPYSNQAYFHAVGLAENYGASLSIVYVYAPPPPYPVEPTVGIAGIAPDMADERDFWRSQLAQIRPLNPGIPVDHVFLEGDPAEEILTYAADNLFDMIVMGTHGRRGLERLLMGSVAEKVLRGANCSVLIVKMPKPGVIPVKKARAEPLVLAAQSA